MAAGTVDLTKPVDKSQFRAFVSPCDFERVTRVIDFEEATTKKGSALAQNDTIDAIVFGAGTVCGGVMVREMKVGTTGTTMQVGDQTTATKYITSVALDGSLQAFAASAATYVFYSAANAVQLCLNAATAVTMGRFEVTALVLKLGTDVTA